MYRGGWCGKSLPRHTHRDLVCTVEAGVAGHFLDTHTGILCVQQRLAWQVTSSTHGDPVCTVEAGVSGSGQLQGECPSRGMLMIAPRIFGQQRVQHELLEKGPD